MKINNREIEMIIFDLDGTLLDSCHVWKDVDKHFFERRHIKMPEDYGRIIAPLGFEKASEYTKKTFNLEESCEEIMNEWRNEVVNLYEDEIGLKKDAKRFLDLCQSLGVPMNVATANQENCYAPCLKRNKIDHYFDTIIDVKEFKGGKNSPEIYLEIAKRTNVDPSKIMVIEDIAIALESAKKASFFTCAIYEETSEEEELKKQISDLYINSFAELISLVKKENPMNKIKVNVYAQGLDIQGQGVGSACIEQMEMVKNIEDFDVNINPKGHKNDCDIRHIHTVNPGHYHLLNKKRVNIVDVHFIPEIDDGSLKMPKFMFGPYRAYTLSFYRKADEIIVVNPYFIDDLKKIGIPEDKITYIPNVVSKERFHEISLEERNKVREGFGLKADDFVILGVGQTQTRKGIQDFVEIAKRNPDLQFIWAGGFTFGKITAGYEEIKKMMDNPPANMKFLGIIDRSHMNEVYNACDVLFLPSYQELFPMTLLECINCDKPFLVRDLELYDRIFTKTYIKGTNNDEFEKILRKMHDDPKFYQEAKDISIELAKFYSVENVTKLWKDYYKRIYSKYPNKVRKIEK